LAPVAALLEGGEEAMRSLWALSQRCTDPTPSMHTEWVFQPFGLLLR
jgi:hypothetical protein